ncbi:MAG: hypothetical protein PHU23_12500 [Dehalococcoidales bacterium]|nr:hypothetical protein [Dehalococcoidales bacterium]
MSIPRLSNKHQNLGFEFTKSENNSFILKHRDMIVCVIGSQLDFKDEMLAQICDCYLKKKQVSEK